MLNTSGLYMKYESQKKYQKTEKGKEALSKAQKKYEDENLEKRREQKREYMRRKRTENPNYCKWK
jgi:hypothetical protein